MPIIDQQICARCGHARPTIANFCPHCGTAAAPVSVRFTPVRQRGGFGRGILIWIIFCVIGMYVFKNFAVAPPARLPRTVDRSPSVDPNYFQPVAPDRDHSDDRPIHRSSDRPSDF
jgi:hypothetical protein